MSYSYLNFLMAPSSLKDKCKLRSQEPNTLHGPVMAHLPVYPSPTLQTHPVLHQMPFLRALPWQTHNYPASS